MSRRKNPAERIIIIQTGKPRQEKFVSIEAYNMLSNAFASAMEEITRLKAKLKNIQEIIKDVDE